MGSEKLGGGLEGVTGAPPDALALDALLFEALEPLFAGAGWLAPPVPDCPLALPFAAAEPPAVAALALELSELRGCPLAVPPAGAPGAVELAALEAVGCAPLDAPPASAREEPEAVGLGPALARAPAIAAEAPAEVVGAAAPELPACSPRELLPDTLEVPAGSAPEPLFAPLGAVPFREELAVGGGVLRALKSC